MKEIIERVHEWITLQQTGAPEHYEGSDWWQVNEDEQGVFNLEPDTMIKIVPVYLAFEAIAGIGQNEFFELPLCEEARKELPWITQDTIIEEEFTRFASMFDISKRIAHAFFWKHSFWEIRQGHWTFEDEK